jgi:hypothetical protein
LLKRPSLLLLKIFKNTDFSWHSKMSELFKLISAEIMINYPENSSKNTPKIQQSNPFAQSRHAHTYRHKKVK